MYALIRRRCQESFILYLVFDWLLTPDFKIRSRPGSDEASFIPRKGFDCQGAWHLWSFSLNLIEDIEGCGIVLLCFCILAKWLLCHSCHRLAALARSPPAGSLKQTPRFAYRAVYINSASQRSCNLPVLDLVFLPCKRRSRWLHFSSLSCSRLCNPLWPTCWRRLPPPGAPGALGRWIWYRLWRNLLPHGFCKKMALILRFP